MSIEKQEAIEVLNDYRRFSNDSAERECTDTGIAWNLLDRLAAVLAQSHNLVEGDAVSNHTPINLAPGDLKYLQEQRDGTLRDVIDRRVQVYGDPVVGFAEIAAVWSTYLGHEIQAHEVPMMFILMKIIRSKTSPDYSDHSDDIEGYLDIFRKVIGPDMIQARTVNEYIEKKWGEQA